MHDGMYLLCKNRKHTLNLHLPAYKYFAFICNIHKQLGHITCITVLILQKQRELEFVKCHMDESDSMLHVS